MRIRQKIMGDHSDPRNDRLASIPQRTFPKPPVGIDPSALEGMSAVELYETAGIDMSVYTLD